MESIDPGSILPLTLRAQVNLFNGKYAEAETDYRRLLTLNRSGFVTYYGGISYLSALGLLRFKANDISEGKTLLQEAAQLHASDSDGPQTIYDHAAIRATEGKKGAALALLRQSITAGWMDYRVTQIDPRFEALRDDPAFGQMLSDLSQHVVSMRAVAETLCSKPLTINDYPVRPPGK